MATEILSLCSSTVDLLRDYVLKHLCYVIQVGQNVEELNDKAGMLEAKENDVSQKIAAAERANKMPTSEVNDWLRRVGDLQREAQSIGSDYGQRNCVMFGSCSFNCFSNYSIGRRAAKELLKVEAELNYCNDKEITTEPLPPPAQEMPTTTLTAGSSVASEIESKLQSALDFLRDDAEGALGVWGMGGVGKTTLLEHINNSLAKDPSFGFFHHVIFMVASRECTVEKIQELLEKKLSLSNGRQIFNHLSTKNFVLLLDDVWETLDLKKVGIPFPLGTVGQYKRKVILTTRSQQVCHNMDIRRSIRVECLSQEAARALFREKAGVDVICSHPWIPELADRVVDECNGLPLALITIGRAMSGNQTVQVWENAIALLRKSKISEIQGMDDPLPLLKFSYDHLKNPMEKECFLHCALWPEDYEIKKKELIRCWMGHGLLREFDDIQEAYNRGHAIINSLQKACLLEYVEVGKYKLKNDKVELHDIIRDMALWIARDCGANEKKWIVLAGLGMEEAPHDERTWSEAYKMSLMNNKFRTLPSKIQNSSKLTTLMLQRNYKLASDGMGIIKYFHTLKFLDLSSCTELKSVPIEISGLKKLEYLNLSKTGITSLPVELKNLTNLKYLIARDNEICEVPTELVRNLVNLLELDLFTEIDDINQSSIINNLDCFEGHLKALGINVSTVSDLHKLVRLFRIPVRALAIQHMEGLTSLELLSQDVLGSQHMHSTLDTLFIQNCDSDLTELVVSEKYYLPLDSLYLCYLPSLKEVIWKGVEPKDVLSKLRELIITECSELKHVSWVVNLPCLEFLQLNSCENLQHFVWEDAVETEETYRLAFPTLRSLQLYDLPKLSTLCHRALTFPSLEFLIVSKCAELKKLPFHSPPCLSNLDKIKGGREWWESLELEDDTRVSLQPFFKPWLE